MSLVFGAIGFACGPSSADSQREPLGRDGGGGGIVQPPDGMTVTLMTADERGVAVANAEFVLRDASGGYFTERTGADGTFVAKYVRPPYDVLAITKVGRSAFMGLGQANVRLPVYRAAEEPTKQTPPPLEPKRGMTQPFNVLLPACGTNVCPTYIRTRTPDPNRGAVDIDVPSAAPASTYPALVLHRWNGPWAEVKGDARLLVSNTNYTRYWYDRLPMSFIDGVNAASRDWQPLPVENAGQLTVSTNLQDIPDNWSRTVGANLVYPDDLSQGSDAAVSIVPLAQSSATVTMGVPNIVGATLDTFANYENPDWGPDVGFERTRVRRGGLPLTTANVQLAVVRPPLFIRPARGARISATADWSWQTFGSERSLTQIFVDSESSDSMVIYTQQTTLSSRDLQFLGVDRSPGTHWMFVETFYPVEKLDDLFSLESTKHGFPLRYGDSYTMSYHSFIVEP
ncbi:hypothetical protein LVJ94_07960 [Pendulispora rubella]|uniref:Carboxypeptidase regulatory-like domain-containing protein n=1 Tax=Pendulispora rubella TaxID=2741070 RepID=A0ABZ2LC79_9BACT